MNHGRDQSLRIFGRDELIYNDDDDMIGSGGFGVVYRCKIQSSSEVVALKVLTTPYKLQKSEVADFVKEARILQGLTDCPYIIRFLGLCDQPGHYAIVMEYIENGNLEVMLLSDADKHPVIQQWDCRIKIALDIAKGMDYLHGLPTPIIHRDLKTANILVDHNYSCKIIDFGLAKVRGISEKIPSRRPYAATVAFSAPELFEGKGKIEKEKEKKLDVYSYAVILWQLKEMKQVYDGLSPSIIRANVLSGVRPLLSDDDCMDEYRDLMIRCWDVHPDARLHFREIVTMFLGMIRRPSCPRCSTAGTDGVDGRMTTVTSVPDGDDGSSVILGSVDAHSHQMYDTSQNEGTLTLVSDSHSSPSIVQQGNADIQISALSQQRDVIRDGSSVELPQKFAAPSLGASGIAEFRDPLNSTLPVETAVSTAGSSPSISSESKSARADITSKPTVEVTRKSTEPVQFPSRKWAQLTDLPQRRPFLNCIASVEGNVIVGNQVELYIGDIESSCNLWRVCKTVPETGAKIHTLFSAKYCFTTYYHYQNSSHEKSHGIAWYDIINNSWQHVCYLPPYSQLHQYSAVADQDNIYLVGGNGDLNKTNSLDTVLKYDLRSGQQSGGVKLNLQRKRKNCSSVIIDNMLYVAGGQDSQENLNSVEAISLSDFSHLTVAPTPCYSCSCTVACESLVVAGGRVSSHEKSRIGNTAVMWDSSNRTWIPLPDMNDDRLWLGMCAADGVILAAGGYCGGTFSDLKSVEALRVQP